MLERMQYVQDLIREKLKVAAKTMSEWHNRDVRLASFDVGQKVRVYNPHRVKGRSHKWQLLYTSVGEVVA